MLISIYRRHYADVGLGRGARREINVDKLRHEIPPPLPRMYLALAKRSVTSRESAGVHRLAGEEEGGGGGDGGFNSARDARLMMPARPRA